MKRMYVVVGLILLVMLGAVGALSQIITQQDNSSPPERAPFDRMKRRMELREEMHRRMRDKLLHGLGPDQDLFKDMDKAFEDAMSDSFTGMDQMGPALSNFKSEWTETTEGRVLVLTPQSKEQKLNIDVNATVITIKGDSVRNTSTGSITSSFSSSFSVPADVDGTKVKMGQKDGKILVELPYKSAPQTVITPQKNDRQPLKPLEGDVQI